MSPTKQTFYAGLFHRLKPKIAAKGAAWAVAHRVGKVIWLIMNKEVEYQEQGQAAPNPQTQARKIWQTRSSFSYYLYADSFVHLGGEGAQR